MTSTFNSQPSTDPEVVIGVENLYKEYRLGTISHGTLYRDLQSWWARMRGKEDPNSIISTVQPSTGGSNEPSTLNLQPSPNNPHFLALNNVSFEVKRGEVLGIIGRNGAGKSTLLKILSEVTSPSKGTVKIKGRVASLLEVGTGFHPELTGRENIYLNGAILGMTKKEIASKFDEIVAFAEVHKFIDTPVKRYSSGMYVRLAFAVAAHLEPEILIVDEVLAVGDAQFQKKCLGKMGEVAKEGRTVLFVSHNMAAIQRLCRKCLLFEKGVLTAQGDTQQIIEQYIEDRSGEQMKAVELDRLPRSEGLGMKIRFASCRVLNSKGEEVERLLFGEDFSVQVEAAAAAEVHDISIIIGIDTAMEYRIATLASEDSGVLFSASPGQVLRVSMQAEHLTLKPGYYAVSLGIRTGRSPLDHLLNIVCFEVVKTTSEDHDVRSDTFGVVHVGSQWTSEAETLAEKQCNT